MKEQRADDVERADHDRAKDRFGDPTGIENSETGNAADNLVQVAVAIEDHRVVIPSLPRPEPNPARPADKCSDEDQENPHQEPPTKHVHREPSLPQRVVTIAERI